MLWFVNSKSQENVEERKDGFRGNSVLFDGRKSGEFRERFCRKPHSKTESEKKRIAFAEFFTFRETLFDGFEQFFLGVVQTGKQFFGTEFPQMFKIGEGFVIGSRTGIG